MSAKIIAIAIQKGGVGKTTTAVNLAHAFAYKPFNKRVLVIDMDPQSNATAILCPDPNRRDMLTIYDVLTDDNLKISACVTPSSVKNVSIIPSTITAFGLNNIFGANSPKNFLGLKIKFDKDPSILESYDYIIIDCQPNITGPFVANALAVADHLIIPLAAESLFGLQGVEQFMQLLKEMRAINPNINFLGTLVTTFDGRTIASDAMTQQIINYFGADKVFKQRISKSTSISKAEIGRKTCIQYDTRTSGAKDYRQLAYEILTQLNDVPDGVSFGEMELNE